MGPLRSLLCLVGVLLIIACSFSGRSQTLGPSLTTFDQQDFKAHHQVFCARSLPDGRTAFGVIGDVLLYNGEGFEHVPVSSSGKAVFSMATASNGDLFIGGRSLMGMIAPDSNGTMTFRSLKHLLPDSLDEIGIVWRTLTGSDGQVYFASAQHLFHYDGDSIKVLRPEQRWGLAFPMQGRPVIHSVGKGLFRIEGGRKEKLPGSKSFLKDRRIMAILPSAEGSSMEWTVFTEAQGIFYYDPSNGESTPFPANGVNDGLKELYRSKIYTACRLSPEKNPYGAAYAVGTRRAGLYLLDKDGQILIQLSSQDGLPADLIWKVAEARRGNLWAATNDGIALIQIGRSFKVAKKGDGFEGSVQDIDRPERPADAPLYLATSQGVWKWRNDKSSFSLLEGTAGQSWDLLSYGTDDKGARMLIAGGRDKLLTAPIGIDSESRRHGVERLSIGKGIKSLARLPYPSDGGSVLMGGRSGLKVFTLSDLDQKAARKKLLSIRKIPEGINRAMVWDTSRTASDSIRLWAGMPSKGVISVTTDTAFTGHRVVHYDTSHGLPKGEVLPLPDPSSKGSGVLFGTEKGLYSFEGGSFRPDPSYGEMFSDGSRQVFKMKKGVRGVVWIDDAKGGQAKRLFPKADGTYQIDSTIFRSLELGAIRSILPEEGRTWFGGDRGLASYFPEVVTDLDEEWHCLFREIRGSRDSLLFGGSFSKKVGSKQSAAGSTSVKRVHVEEQPEKMTPSLPYSRNRMEFAFAAPFPIRQSEIEYSYKLSGFDTAWSKWTKEAKKEYTNLSEGNYTFKVKARNIYLKESDIAEYHFTILPPWYRTNWAYAGYGVTAGLTLALIAWLWVRKHRADQRAKAYLEGLENANQEIREEKEKVEEKNQALEDANKTISKQKEEVEEVHREITQSIDYAQKIQFALLQSEEQVSPHLPEHFILFKPQAKVSGDFYWAREHKGYLYIAAVDCTGHGVPGAFMSMLGISQLNEIMNTDETLTPGYILTELRDRVLRELSSSDPQSAAKDGMDAALVKIPIAKEQGVRSKEGEAKSEKGEAGYEKSHSQGEGFNPHRTEGEKAIQVQFAGAQNPLYVIRSGIAEDPPSIEMDDQGEGIIGLVREPKPIRPFKRSPDGIEIKGDAQPVGYDEYAKDAFTTVKLQLQKGDMLYFFSDGYADQFGGPHGKKFRYAPFKQLLVDLHDKAIERQKEQLDKTFEDWKAEGEQEQIDDVVVIGVRL